MNAQERGLRAIALFETAKGLLALAALGLALHLLHHDLRALMLDWIDALGIDPEAHLAALLLQYADTVANIDPRLLVGVALAYAGLRFVEAWGLWWARRWAEYLGAGSGIVYVPFELTEFVHKPGPLTASVLLVNLGIVAYLVWYLWQGRSGAAHSHDT